MSEIYKTIIAIIPARGGSKSIPRKNSYPLSGKPLISYTLTAVFESQYITKTYVSTDDDEIAVISKSYGAEVIIRPPEISGDEASSESALLHVLTTLKNISEPLPDLIVFLQCTSPLTLNIDINAAIERLIESDADTCFSATPSHAFIWQVESDGRVKGINHDQRYRQRRQEMEPQYRENGAIYVMKTDGFMKTGHRFFGKTVLSVMPPERSWDIDEPMDLVIVESIMKLLNTKDQ
jgi:CMP-N-acetylneuraminic acid synthetase